MASLLRMPEVATDTAEATLVSWAIAENVPYAARDPIVCVETAKAVVDVEAESAGIIFKTLVVGGTDVKVGEPIAVIGVPGERVDDLDAVLVQLGVGPSGAEDGLDEPASENAVVTLIGERDVAPTSPVGDAAPAIASGTRPVPARSRTFISPLARRLARSAGLDIAEIRGTGPGQRIVRRDVEGAIAHRGNAAIDTLPSALPTPTASAADPRRRHLSNGGVTQLPASEYVDTPHSRLRRAIAARLTESTQTAPHFYLSGAPCVDRLLRLRRQLNEPGDVRVSVNDLVIRAVARAHELVPAMNVVWNSDAVRQFARVDVGIAVATESGLVTPVIRDAASLRVTRIASLTRDFAERARSGLLQQHELEGGSVTVTNLGMFGTLDFAAIINPPQAAILAVGAAVEQPVARKGKVAVATVMRVTLSVDHRPVDGATAAKWMREFVALIENPIRILA
jgi:pyruvate dehydrogenase E2 component (dihydrolipoamide acetyltransferase)